MNFIKTKIGNCPIENPFLFDIDDSILRHVPHIEKILRPIEEKTNPEKEKPEYIKKETNLWLEITNLVIPDENDSEKEFHEMTEWITANLGVDVPLHFTAFHPDFKMMDKIATPATTLTKARAIALSKGLRYVYTGNVHDPTGGSTYCHNCGKLLIERDWYEMGEYNLVNKNQCKFCSAICPGHFDVKPGGWGSKRMPIQIAEIPQ